MKYDYDVCVIGGGAAGLTVAGGAGLFGLRSCIIEHGAMGGDCLNRGCVPSKAFIATANSFHDFRQNLKLASTIDGIEALETESLPADFRITMERVNQSIATIAEHDSVERMEAMGCTVIQGHGTFLDDRTLEVEGQRITSRYFVIATGSEPMVPDGLGLADIVAFTTDNIWMLRECPEHLIVLGGGAIGVELGQAFKRLGAEVTIIERSKILSGEDSDAVAIIRAQLEREGISLYEDTDIMSFGPSRGQVAARIRSKDGVEDTIKGDAVLVAAGRKPVTDGIGLDKAGVKVGDNGIVVGPGLKTSNPRIFAVGDVRGEPYATNLSGHDAIVALKRMLFKLPASRQYSTIPRVIFSSPELARVGMSATEAKAKLGPSVRVIDIPFTEIDRAICERDTTGFARLILTSGNKVLGCMIVGDHAGELIAPWVLAVAGKISLADISAVTFPYPVRTEITKALVNKALEERTFSPFLKRLAKFLVRL